MNSLIGKEKEQIKQFNLEQCIGSRHMTKHIFSGTNEKERKWISGTNEKERKWSKFIQVDRHSSHSVYQGKTTSE